MALMMATPYAKLDRILQLTHGKEKRHDREQKVKGWGEKGDAEERQGECDGIDEKGGGEERHSAVHTVPEQPAHDDERELQVAEDLGLHHTHAQLSTYAEAIDSFWREME